MSLCQLIFPCQRNNQLELHIDLSVGRSLRHEVGQQMSWDFNHSKVKVASSVLSALTEYPGRLGDGRFALLYGDEAFVSAKNET